MGGIGSVGGVLAGKYATYGDSNNRNNERQQQTANSKQQTANSKQQTANSQNTETTDRHGNNTDKINSAFDLIRVGSVPIRGLRVLAVSDPRHGQEPARAHETLADF
jgi:hypothetical protein